MCSHWNTLKVNIQEKYFIFTIATLNGSVRKSIVEEFWSYKGSTKVSTFKSRKTKTTWMVYKSKVHYLFVKKEEITLCLRIYKHFRLHRLFARTEVMSRIRHFLYRLHRIAKEKMFQLMAYHLLSMLLLLHYLLCRFAPILHL